MSATKPVRGIILCPLNAQALPLPGAESFLSRGMDRWCVGQMDTEEQHCAMGWDRSGAALHKGSSAAGTLLQVTSQLQQQQRSTVQTTHSVWEPVSILLQHPHVMPLGCPYVLKHSPSCPRARKQMPLILSTTQQNPGHGSPIISGFLTPQSPLCFSECLRAPTQCAGSSPTLLPRC